MTDVSMLSQEYKTAAELSEIINGVLVTLKKQKLGLGPASGDDESALQGSRIELANILENLRRVIDTSGTLGTHDVKLNQIPGSLVTRLRADYRGDLGYYVEDIHRLSEQLRSEQLIPSDNEMKILDDLASMADAETTGVFRQLMRR